MIILGLDPGTSLIGYGIINYSKNTTNVIDYGTIVSAKNIPTKERILEVNNQLNNIIARYQPDHISIEELFFFKNAKTVIAVAEMRGALLAFSALKNIPIHEFTPLQIKQSVTGYGRAEKSQVQEMVRLILELDTIPKPDDASDALAAAICCAHTLKPTEDKVMPKNTR